VATDVQLHLGDCLEFLKTLEPGAVDAVITDPPYGMKYKSGPISSSTISTTRKRFSTTIRGDDSPFDPSPWLRFPSVAFTGAQWFYDRLPAGGSLHCWDKRGEYKPLDQADADMVWASLRTNSRVFHLVWRGLCRHAENRDRIEHPTQKPVALMKWMIGLLKLPAGSTIFDPYMGSGTTGVAAVQLGMKFIGCELDPTYFQIAERRIAAEREKTALFA
jgi:site-specific DNA-methyltransferase (adenine-specific)